MDVASLCPLPVGVVAWQSPGHVLTVIVKATFTLGLDGKSMLAPVQEPLSLDRPSPLGGEDELEYASDFAPLKARVDVLLTGHAYAEAPTRTIAARVAVDELERRFYAVAAEPTSYIPLVGGYLRSSPAPDAAVVRVGPLAPWSPTRAPYADSSVISPDGPPSRPLTSRFDFRFFNAAPPEQQVELLRAAARISLEGLLPGAPRLTVHLPALLPKVFYLGDGLERAGARADPVALRCDTLWIQTDRAICTMTWRGVLVEQDRASSPCLVMTMQSRGEEQPWRAIRHQLDRASMSTAVEVASLRMGQAPANSAAAPRGGSHGPLSAKKFHEVSPLRAFTEPREGAPPAATRGMMPAEASPQARAGDEAVPERSRQQPKPASRRGQMPEGRGLHEDVTMDSPYGTADEPTLESPYRISLSSDGVVDEATPSPDTTPSTMRGAFFPEEPTAGATPNPLEGASTAPPRAPGGKPEPDGKPKRPPLPPIADDPTVTMNERIEVPPLPPSDPHKES